MSRVLIIGYGNPLRRDDGVGWHIAHALRAKNSAEDVEILACYQLTPDLAEPLSRAQRAIFVDATVDTTHGDLYVQTISANGAVSPRFSHHVTPQTLLAQANAWYGSGPRVAYLVSVCARDTGLGENLSARVAKILPLALREVNWLCAATREPNLSKA